MERLRITIEIDTDMTREQFNRHVNTTAHVFAASLGEMVYLATETVNYNITLRINPYSKMELSHETA